MARVFLLNPPSPEPVRTPLLSLSYLAASLLARGHQVALLDASAPFAPQGPGEIAARIADFAPDLVGLHVKTLHVQPAYALSRTLGERWPLCAGGPHATVCPEEPLAHGFRFVVRGEGEDTLCDLADALDRGGADFAGSEAPIAGLSLRDAEGRIRHGPERGFLLQLDAVASPVDAFALFDPAWYGRAGERELPPAGLLSSRGCPAACTFCCNNVTGRRFRYRSAAQVAAEVGELRRRYGLCAFSFFDDSFAVGRRRMQELCAALRAVGPVYWSCTAHPAHLDREVLRDMKSAGCGGVDIGMESADPEMLLRIGKGVRVERVLDVLGWARDAGIHTVVNLMFGWPAEGDAELEATIGFLERAADLAGAFNARGVLVPYPGTALYEEHHLRYGFTEWWLREEPLAYRPFPQAWDEAEIGRAYADDPALARNFFRHPPHRLRRIGEALGRKAELTLRGIRRSMGQQQPGAVPAAGAR